MRKTILLIKFLVFIALASYSQQFSGVYRKYNEELDVRYYLQLHENKYCYLTFFNQMTHDIIHTIPISVGEYSIDKDTIYLNDVNGYQMKLLQKQNNNIEVIHGFSFLSDTFFTFFSTTDSFIHDKHLDELVKMKKSLVARKKDLQEYKSSFKGLFVLREGSYVWGYEELDLNLRKDNTYKLYYKKDILLLEGTWRRDGNLLFLYDTHLQYEFPAKISAEGIIGQYLPAVFAIPNYLLKYKSDN